MTAASIPFTTRRRPATVLLCVLACLAIVTALVTSTTQMALQVRRSMRSQHQLRQVELLLEAGVDRAAQRLAIDPEYTGETWNLLPKTIPGVDEARVSINVSSDDVTWPPEVTIVATLGSEDSIRVKRSHTFPLEVSLSPLGD